MFSITTKSQYGITAVLELAKNYNGGLLQIRQISNRCDLPKTYIEQIFNKLRREGIIESVRGNSGGYRLAESPENTTLLDIIATLEGDFQLQNKKNGTKVNKIFAKAEEKLRETLRVPLAHLIDENNENSYNI